MGDPVLQGAMGDGDADHLLDRILRNALGGDSAPKGGNVKSEVNIKSEGPGVKKEVGIKSEHMKNELGYVKGEDKDKVKGEVKGENVKGENVKSENVKGENAKREAVKGEVKGEHVKGEIKGEIKGEHVKS